MGRKVWWRASQLNYTFTVRPLKVSGTPPPLFSTPMSNFSVTTGGISQVPKFGLVYCRDAKAISGGAIGSGSVDIIHRICSKPSSQDRQAPFHKGDAVNGSRIHQMSKKSGLARAVN
jgi:hypothetical protein